MASLAAEQTTMSITACIVAGGRVTDGPRVRAVLNDASLIIAADRGIRACMDLDATPRLCIGDFDSVSPDDLQRARALGWPIEEHPAEKAATDGELALEAALKYGATRITILGALEGADRVDHAIANVLLLAREDLRQLDVRLVDEMREAFLIRGGEASAVTGDRGDFVSLLPLSGQDAVVSTWGLKYDLTGVALAHGATRGMSNELVWGRAEIHVAVGQLLIMHERRASSQ